MMLKFILLGILIVFVFSVLQFFLPRLKLKYRLYKELKETEKRKKAFNKKMKELEIK